MISFIETILGTVLSSFAIIIASAFMALIADFLFPSFAKWTRILLIFLIVGVALQPAIGHLELIREIARSVSVIFISIYPVLTAGMVMAGGAFGLLNFQPAMLLFANGAVLLAERVLIPLLTATFLFDLVSRLLPDIPFTRMADMLRTTLLAVVSATVATYSIFITAGGTMSWAISGLTSEPVKELIRQNIPLIGSFMTDTIGTMGRYTTGASVFAGGWMIMTIWTVALVPSIKTLLVAFFYRWTAALIEPFADEDIAGILDDIGKTLFVLCAVSFLISFAFIYTSLISIVFIKLFTTLK